MKTTSWVSVAVVCAAVAGAGGQNPNPAPPPREKPTNEAWLPKPGFGIDPPSAFPDIVPPIPDEAVKDAAKRIEQFRAAFEKMCPRLFGAIGLKIEPTDDTLRKLLKARLHQAVIEFQLIGRAWPGPMTGPSINYDRHRECILDLQATATELWANQPKELVPWLEELIIASKYLEWSMGIQLRTGTRAPDELCAARRVRLKMETELWKAKNPK